MSLQNYVLYGGIYSHVPVRYDPDTLFLMTDSIPPSDYNRESTDPNLNRIVWMFGGSTVRCNAQRNKNTTLPSFVARFLNEKAKPNHFTVVNFGENGFNSLLESKYLEKALTFEKRTPDVIVFYDGANDCLQYVEHRQPDGHIGYRRLKAFIESYRMGWLGLLKPINAALYASYTNEFIDRIRMLAEPVRSDSPTLERMVTSSAARYDHIFKLAHCYDAEFLLIWQPILWAENCSVTTDVHQAERTMFLDVTKFPVVKESLNATYNELEATLKNKPYFVSLRDSLCGRTTGLFEPDGIHLTTRGDELMAGIIGELLIKTFPEKLLPH
jgi:lysophospholipase L1-like esterase